MHQALHMRLCSILSPAAGTGVNPAGGWVPSTGVCCTCMCGPAMHSTHCILHSPGVPVPHSWACGVAEMSHRESATCAGQS